jgi:ATP-dependent DNA ligase
MTPTAITACAEESAKLECRMGGSDKVYHIQLTQSEAGWAVHAQNGPRGGTLTPQKAKIQNAPYAEAKKIYEGLIAEKRRGKGDGTHYSLIGEAQATAPTAPIAPTLGSSRGSVSPGVIVFAGEMPTRCTEQEARQFASNPRYIFENKEDGDRLTICKNGEQLHGYNKKGEVVALDVTLHAAITKLCAAASIDNLVLDGEWEADGFHAHDVLECKIDLREYSYALRLEARETLLGNLPPDLASVLHLTPTADTTEAKLAMLDQRVIEQTGKRFKVREGIVIKDRMAAFCAGRSGQHFKFKFEFEASFIVGAKPRPNDGKRSIALYILDFECTPALRFVCTCKVVDRDAMPVHGDIVEARYLAAFPTTGGIEQPCYFGRIRTDVRPQDCTTAQLIYKPQRA